VKTSPREVIYSVHILFLNPMSKKIKLESLEGQEFEVEKDAICMSETIRNMLTGISVCASNSLPSASQKNKSILMFLLTSECLHSLDISASTVDSLPLSNIKGETLKKIIEYCEYHHAHPSPVAPDKEDFSTDNIEPWFVFCGSCC
jgi:hypothetical protein